MKIAIPSIGENLGSPTDPQFWRAEYFQIFNNLGNQEQILKNPYSGQIERGVDILVIQFLIDNAITALLIESIDPELFYMLHSAGMKIFLGPSSCNVQEFVEKYLKGELDEIKGRQKK